MRRLLAFAPALLLAASASATELNLAAQIDGARKDLGPVVVEFMTYRVDLAKALPALTDGRATLRQVGAGECRVVVDGKDRVRLNLGLGAEPTAVVLPGEGKLLKLTEAPRFEKLKAGGSRVYLDVRALGALTGVGVDLDRKSLTFQTPESWARGLGIDDERLKGLNARMIGHAPDFGITPPGLTMLAWVRPAAPAFVQIYKGLPAIPAPMLAVSSQNGEYVVREGDQLPTMWPASPSSPAQAPTQHTEVEFQGQIARYAAVVSSKNLGGDPIAAINRGEAEDWSVVGVQQRVVKGPLVLRTEPLRAGESLGAFADRQRMPLELLMAMNGYGEAPAVKAGTPLIVLDHVDPVKPLAKIAGLYEIGARDTVESLAARWKVPADAICAQNDLEEGESLDPGAVILRLAPATVVAYRPPPSEPRIAPTERTARTKASVEMRRTSAPGAPAFAHLPGGTTVSVVGTKGGLCYVQYGQGERRFAGWVPADALGTPPTARTELVALANPRAAQIRTEALRYLGTPYQWGGTDLRHGIDCSHFVAAVLARCGAPAPSPPVASQETQGHFVHWMEGPALHGDRTISFPNAECRGPASYANIQVGDRVIIQHPPLSQRQGGRHTGLYIGAYPGIAHAVVHAGSHGIAVSSLEHFISSGYRYTVHDDVRRPGAPARRTP